MEPQITTVDPPPSKDPRSQDPLDQNSKTRILYFFLFAGYGCVEPYFAIFLFSVLKFSANQVGLINSITPLVAIFSSPALGMMADYFQTHQSLLFWMLCVYAGSRLLFIQSFVNTFYIVLAIRTLFEMFGSAIRPLTDSIVLTTLTKSDDSYGKQRLWGGLGWGTTALIVGFLDDADPTMNINFIVSCACMSAAALALLSLEVSSVPATQSMWKGLQSVFLSNHIVLMFFFVVLVMGAGKGIVSNFLFIFLESLGAKKSLMGLSLFITCASEIPMFYFSGALNKRFGPEIVLIIATFSMVVRLILYSTLENPYWVLPMELLHGSTFGLMVSAGVEYSYQIAPPGMTATLQGVFYSVYFGLGNGVGTLAAGFVFDVIGPRSTFLGAGIVVAASLLVFSLFIFLDRRRKSEYKEIK